MIDKKKAINIVIEAMSESLVIDIELGVAEDEIVEFEDGFIIRYDSKEAIKNPYSNMNKISFWYGNVMINIQLS